MESGASPGAPVDAQIPTFTNDSIPILVDSRAGQPATNGAAGSAVNLRSPRSRVMLFGGIAAAVAVLAVVIGIAVSPSKKPAPVEPPSAPTVTPPVVPLAPPPIEVVKSAPRGELTLSINVRSQVNVDGKSIAGSVRTLALPLEPGEHDLQISAPGYQTATPRVHIESGRTLRLPITLSRAKRAPSSTTTPATPTTTPAKTPSTGKPGNREYMLDPFGEPR
jgi:hypothetical protein